MLVDVSGNGFDLTNAANGVSFDLNSDGTKEKLLWTAVQTDETAIECDYKEARRRDQYGNQFRYRAKVQDMRNTQISRWAWDVFLVRDTNSILNVLLDPVSPQITGSVLEWLRK